MEVRPAARRRSGPRGHAGGRQGERKPVGRGSQPVGPMEPSLRAGRERRALQGIAVQPGPGKESGAVLRGGLRAKHRRVLCAILGSTSREGEKKWGKKRKKKREKKGKKPCLLSFSVQRGEAGSVHGGERLRHSGATRGSWHPAAHLGFARPAPHALLCSVQPLV